MINSELESIRHSGQVVRVISDQSLVFVKTVGTFENSDGGTHNEEITVPAKILYKGSKGVREYFCYEEGENVFVEHLREVKKNEANTFKPDCNDFPNFYEKEMFAVLGSFYDDTKKQPAFYDKIRMTDFGIGSITIDLEEKTLDVEFEGEITINGKEIYLNG